MNHQKEALVSTYLLRIESIGGQGRVPQVT